MGKFNLIVQYPTVSKTPVNGALSVDQTGEALFWTGDGGHNTKIAASMTRVKIDSASLHGILLSGIERRGDKLLYQEWWLVYAGVIDDCGAGANRFQP